MSSQDDEHDKTPELSNVDVNVAANQEGQAISAASAEPTTTFMVSLVDSQSLVTDMIVARTPELVIHPPDEQHDIFSGLGSTPAALSAAAPGPGSGVTPTPGPSSALISAPAPRDSSAPRERSRVGAPDIQPDEDPDGRRLVFPFHCRPD